MSRRPCCSIEKSNIHCVSPAERRHSLALERMHLKKVLRQVDPNPDKGSHGRLPYPRPAPVTPWHLMPFGRGRPHYHYGLFANANRGDNIAKARALLGADPPAADPQQPPDVPPDAAMPMPPLRRPHDRHRGLRARLRATVATDPNRERYIMNQTACQRRRLSVPLRRLHAGDDLAQPDSWPSMRPAPVDALQNQPGTLLSLSRPPPRAGMQACRSHRPTVPPPSNAPLT